MLPVQVEKDVRRGRRRSITLVKGLSKALAKLLSAAVHSSAVLPEEEF